jgi:hypothetical protein
MKIGDIILLMEGFTFATALELTMGYYHIKLNTNLQKFCIMFTWGNFKYEHLPMWIKITSGVFQNVMSVITQDMEYVRIYLDDLLILTHDTSMITHLI